jgi:hypothetical protein
MPVRAAGKDHAEAAGARVPLAGSVGENGDLSHETKRKRRDGRAARRLGKRLIVGD